MLEKICQKCGARFQTKVLEAKFCSRDCVADSRRTPVPVVEKICEVCSKSFFTKHASARFCSLFCAKSSHASHRLGKKSEELKLRLAATPYRQSELLAVLRENQIISREGGIENIDGFDIKQLELVLNNWDGVVHQMEKRPNGCGPAAEIVQKAPPTARLFKLVLKSYEEAEEYTGIPERRLRRMVARRSIRVVKESPNTVYFLIDHLLEDLADLEQRKFF